MANRPTILMILDGWGYRQESEHNAIAQANTPNWDQWWQHYPHTLLSCDGQTVGLPPQQMGNSEVGHMHIGAGRTILQDYTRINQAITQGDFLQNKVLIAGLRKAKQLSSTVHVLGLLSPGGVHSHEKHIHALLELAAQQLCQRLVIHAILDGRDTPPKSAQASLKALQQKIEEVKLGEIASISGRYYTMDRDQRWERTEAAYQLLVAGLADYQVSDALKALDMAYERGETDEFVQPTLTCDEAVPIQQNDVVIFMNFRADRSRQLSRALTQSCFEEIKSHRPIQLGMFITLTDYARDIPAEVAFPTQKIINNIGEVFAKHKLRQLRIAETEKYAHVTFFLNGGTEAAYPHEERVLIPSPQVATYDQQPEMSAKQVTDELLSAIQENKYDVIICNFANADMVGHTGNFTATVQAIECLDQCLAKIHQQLQQVGGEMLITADHGNAEYMYDPNTQQTHTAHTTQPVPLLYLGRHASMDQQAASLIDIAPSLLQLMGLEIPTEMTGRPLIQLQE